MAVNSYETGYDIVAYVTLAKDRAQNGNPLIIVASNLEEQKQIVEEMSKAIRAEVVQLSCGDYMLIAKK